MKAFVVTGANGYLGGSLYRFLKEQGCTIVSLQRILDDDEIKKNQVRFSLKNSLAPDIFKSAEILVHCAYDPSPVSWRDIEETNIKGSIRLFQAAQAGGIKKIIYISSISAFDNCQSLYGKAKLAIEQEVVARGGLVIRPGLIFGNKLGGFLAGLQSLVIHCPLIPLIGRGDQILYFSHIEDLCRLIFKLSCESCDNSSVPIIAACENGRPFREVLRILAYQKNKSPMLISVPWKIIWFSLKFLELLGIQMRFRSDNVISLEHQNPHPDFSFLKDIGFSFRDFD